MDDPIFDPWSSGDNTAEAPSRPVRWSPVPSSPSSRPDRPPNGSVERVDPGTVGTPRHTSPSGTRGALLEEFVLPSLESVRQRLDAAGHVTRLDPRLADEPPSARFRVSPRLGPLADDDRESPAVLEVVATGVGRGRAVTYRFWLKPLAMTPSHEVSVPAPELTVARTAQVLLDFVEMALGQA